MIDDQRFSAADVVTPGAEAGEPGEVRELDEVQRNHMRSGHPDEILQLVVWSANPEPHVELGIPRRRSFADSHRILSQDGGDRELRNSLNLSKSTASYPKF